VGVKGGRVRVVVGVRNVGGEDDEGEQRFKSGRRPV